MERIVSRLMLTLLLISMLTLSFNIQPVKAGGTVGVQAGDWIKCTYTISGWPSGTPNPEWLKVEFLSVEGTNATVRVTMHMSDGTEQSDTMTVDVAAGGGNFQGLSGFVIPANCTIGDFIYMSGYGNVTIAGETTRTYAGASRTVVYASFSQYGTQLTYYWDKHTGVMVEASVTSGDMTATAKATETNMWQACANCLSVPFHYQSKLYWCGPAALEMVLDFFDENVFQLEIGEVARSYPSITYCDELRRATHFSELSTSMGTEMPTGNITGYFARKFGYAAFEQWGMTLDDLRILVDNGYPVVVLVWYSPAHVSTHFRVVIGYNETHMFVHDPYNNVEWGGAYGGPSLPLENSVFLDLWDYSYYWGMFISPWDVSIDVPVNIKEGDTLTINATVTYPCPPPFPTSDYPASACNATIIFPEGLSLVSGETAKKTLGTGVLSAGDSTVVMWNVKADNPGVFNIRVESEGIILGTVSEKTAPTYLPGYAYEDKIGGMGECIVDVGKTEYPPPGIRDIAILNVEPLLGKAYAAQTVGVEVAAENLGTYNETFGVSAYYDSFLIGVQTVSNLAPNGITNIVFNWNTTNVPPGNHTLRVEATTVPDENNTANNQLTNGMIQIIKHPTPTFVYTATIVNQIVTFDATKSEPNGGQITDYLWDFEGDGIFDTSGPIVNHTYTSTGWQIPNLVIIDTEDLTNFAWWGIYVTTPDETYNIAVTDVTPSKNIVTQGHIVNITVDITNTGNITTEIFDVTAYANTTIIDTLIDVALEIGNSTTLTIEWNTTDFAAGNYTIGATTSPFLSETDTTDNTYTDGTVKIKIPGDINGDEEVDWKDLLVLAMAYGSEEGQEKYVPEADFNSDRKVDWNDLLVLAQNYGK